MVGQTRQNTLGRVFKTKILHIQSRIFYPRQPADLLGTVHWPAIENTSQRVSSTFGCSINSGRIRASSSLAETKSPGRSSFRRDIQVISGPLSGEFEVVILRLMFCLDQPDRLYVHHWQHLNPPAGIPAGGFAPTQAPCHLIVPPDRQHSWEYRWRIRRVLTSRLGQSGKLRECHCRWPGNTETGHLNL